MINSELPDPVANSPLDVEADAPQLLPLLTSCPSIRIYTQSNAHFKELGTLLASHTDAVPLAIVRVKSEEEIAATIRVCEQVSLPLAVRSGGNDLGDRNYGQGAVVIDVRLLNSIIIAADRKSVTVGGGVVSGLLLQALDSKGLDTPVGWGHQIGYAGWACGGGYGVEAGSRGLGVDQILRGRIVVSGGQVVVAGPCDDDDDDAYWSLRGGGAGLFGVVSELTIKVYPKPKVYGGSVVFPMSEIRTVFANLERLYADNFPDHFAGEVFVLNPPGTSGIVNHFFWWQLQEDADDLPEAIEYLDLLKKCGTVMHDSVKLTTPYEFLFDIENPIMEDRQFFANSSCIVHGFTANLGRVLSQHPLPTELSCIVLHNCHGAGSKAEAYRAFKHRMDHLVVGICASCPYADTKTRNAISNWPQEVLNDLEDANLTLPAKYINFNPKELGDGNLYFREEGLKKVRLIKKRFDPNNLFAISTPDLGS